jgi:hypothetical protein
MRTHVFGKSNQPQLFAVSKQCINWHQGLHSHPLKAVGFFDSAHSGHCLFSRDDQNEGTPKALTHRATIANDSRIKELHALIVDLQNPTLRDRMGSGAQSILSLN